MSQWPFSSNSRRFKPHSRSSLFRDGSPESDDMFFEQSPSWNLPNMSRFGSVFDSSPLRSNMRPSSFLSHHFESEPFFRNSGWMDDEMRHGRPESPLGDHRRSPTPQRTASSSRGNSASPGTANQPFFGRHDNGRVPVKVKHESSRSNTPSSSSNDGDNRSDHGAPESPAPAPGVEKHAGVKAKVNSTKYPQQAQRQPKVHHIPIRVEPRDESNSQGRDQTTTSSRDYVTPGSRDDDTLSSKNSNENEKKKGEKSNGGRSTVRIIPVQVTKTNTNTNNDKGVEKPEAEAERGSHIPSPPPPPPPSSGKTRPVELIERILRDLEKLKQRVEKFSGSRNEKEYLYLDEMLTRHLIRLDNIVVEGDNELRQVRRCAIKQVNSCIHLLESRVVTSIDEEEKLDVNENENGNENENESKNENVADNEMIVENVEEKMSEESDKPKEAEKQQQKEEENKQEEKIKMETDIETSEEVKAEQKPRKSEEKELGADAPAPGKIFTSTMEMQISDDVTGKPDDGSAV